jgi:hypothetical protein
MDCALLPLNITVLVEQVNVPPVPKSPLVMFRVPAPENSIMLDKFDEFAIEIEAAFNVPVEMDIFWEELLAVVPKAIPLVAVKVLAPILIV